MRGKQIFVQVLLSRVHLEVLSKEVGDWTESKSLRLLTSLLSGCGVVQPFGFDYAKEYPKPSLICVPDKGIHTKPLPKVHTIFIQASLHRDALALLRRSVFSNTIQSASYAKSTRHVKAKHDAHPVLPPESNSPSQASRSWAIASSFMWFSSDMYYSIFVQSAAILGFAGLAAFFHYNDERRAVPKGHQGSGRSGNVVSGPIIGGPFTLINTEKQTITERNFLGNWVLLYFGYTSSPDLGPEQVQIMAKAIDILESKQNLKILPVFVTIDPQRDTPSQLRAYLQEFDSRIIGLTGPVAAVRQMAQEYRVYFKKVEEDGNDYLVDCSHNMYLLNPKMEVVRCFGVEYNAVDLSETIWKELDRNPS
ncbi:hypothetical protein VNO77_00908 [Canavalia gladiata]|uniref:Uncharacterized protein n=1 Tax=Canavalia gladiata TaxID=3824 RepID=A0AAN9MQA5_CANGL